MRTAAIALALMLSAGGLARAADLDDPVWAQAPDRSDWAKAYPAEAAKAGLSGDVKLRCAAGASGQLQNCAVLQETPVGQGFGAAALSLSTGMELKPNGLNGQPVAGRNLIVPVKFVPALLHSGGIVGLPDWVRKPTAEEVLNYWPTEATAGGRVRLECVVTNRGLMDNCTVSDEAPLGHGLGGAALAMSQIFVMRPMTFDGLPVSGAKVVIPINFEGPADRFQGALRVARTAPYLASPTFDQVAAAFPKSAIGSIASSHVVLRCSLRSDGHFDACDTVSETPPGHGFDFAARSLIKDFRVIVNPKTDHLSDLRVDVPFDFRDPHTPAPSLEVHDPLWIQRISPEGAGRLYPDDALKAGVQSGGATLRCSVIHDGALTDCEVQSETPAGLGFGDAALQIASVMKMNPWTGQGTPVDGMKIVLPIKLVAPQEAPPAAAPASVPAKP
jgi:TonB family protein